MINEKKHVAIVLAAGKGSRMGSDIPKQFLEIAGKPVLYYSLYTMETSFLDEIVLVTGEDQVSYCKQEIVEKYNFKKVKRVIAGGKERYDSVYAGIRAVQNADYIYIQDGARPFLTEEILRRAKENVEQFDACAAGMPSKDTVKIADSRGFVSSTPLRKNVWTIQTPQVFSAALIRKAYDCLYQKGDFENITDDAMVVETMTGKSVKLFEGSYQNIKITTPEDLAVAEAFLRY